jgi:hypothetical protein
MTPSSSQPESAPNLEAAMLQLERILKSHTFAGAEAMRRLLEFLGRRSLDKPGLQIKEYEIATGVLERAASFDPRLDSSVRVVAGRLRAKLTAYYQQEGLADPIIVDLPRGAYTLQFQNRPAPAPPDPILPILPKVARLPRPRRWALWGAIAVSAALVAAALVLVGPRPKSVVESPELEVLWHEFLHDAAGPLLVHSNPEFVGTPSTGMRFFNPKTDSPTEIRDTYTGVGEVMGVYQITRMFALFGEPVRVKRGRLLTWDEARISDVIFLGSALQNPALKEVPILKEFTVLSRDNSPHPGHPAVANNRPSKGEDLYYFASASPPYTEDYAIVALLPGLDPAHRTMVLAGTTTFGTQAAAEFVCRPDKVRELFSRLDLAPITRAPAFEALIHVRISGGVPVQTRLVAVHPRKD